MREENKTKNIEKKHKHTYTHEKTIQSHVMGHITRNSVYRDYIKWIKIPRKM